MIGQSTTSEPPVSTPRGACVTVAVFFVERISVKHRICAVDTMVTWSD